MTISYMSVARRDQTQIMATRPVFMGSFGSAASWSTDACSAGATEADRREVAFAVVGGASSELARHGAADAAHRGRLSDRQEVGASSGHVVTCLRLDSEAANAFITWPTPVESADRYIRMSGAIEATDADRGAKTAAEVTPDDDGVRDDRSSRSANPHRFLPLNTPTPRQMRFAPLGALAFCGG